MSYIIPNGAGVRRDAGTVKLENIVTAANGLGASLARATIKGVHGPTLNTRCNRIYYFLFGSCAVKVADSQLSVRAGDTVLVPKGVRHELDGDAEYLVMNVPEFDPTSEIDQA